MRNLTSYLIISCLFAFNANGREDYYVWIDENGVTNYAERDPKGYSAKFVTKSRSFGKTFTNPERNTPEAASEPVPDSVDPDKLVETQRKKLAAELAATKRSNCEIGKRNLAQLQAYRRIRVTDESGNNRILTNEEKSQKISTARNTIRDNCTG